ncbi:unnamed protein product [Soboliphyme baturini]|uniref:Uncharacterized protein n=1 Tax=Soboliphyme baturini TaxID=241478 RepID=A0A183ICK3_9BILA|nr:unnamed protein product [Soboliphyme baturini]
MKRRMTSGDRWAGDNGLGDPATPATARIHMRVKRHSLARSDNEFRGNTSSQKDNCSGGGCATVAMSQTPPRILCPNLAFANWFPICHCHHSAVFVALCSLLIEPTDWSNSTLTPPLIDAGAPTVR